MQSSTLKKVKGRRSKSPAAKKSKSVSKAAVDQVIKLEKIVKSKTPGRRKDKKMQNESSVIPEESTKKINDTITEIVK